MQDPDFPSRIGRSSKNRFPEIFPAHNLRTGKSENNPARLNLFNCLHVQPFVSLQGVSQNIIMLCKRRRIKNNKIIFILYIT